MNPYKLSTILIGHGEDVRCMTTLGDGVIVSGSRDRTARQWTANGRDFVPSGVFEGATKFVSSLCAVSLPQGLHIAIGSNDSNIRIYSTKSPSQPVAVFRGHTSTVSCLASLSDALVSGSWDCSIRVWEENGRCRSTFQEHEQSVWAVLVLNSDTLLSASADRTIRSWSLKSNSCTNVYSGHSDCVRALTKCSHPSQFLSASNDASIRLWCTSTFQCLRTFYGHANFVYSITCLPNDMFATSSEDRTVKVWNYDASDPVQSFTLPALSLWSVIHVTGHGDDLAVGASDGLIYVLSRDPQRQAPLEEQEQLNQNIAKSCVSSQTMVGNIKVSDLPTSEHLNIAGTKEGQTKMVREPGSLNPILYQWSSGTWQRVGEIVGSEGSSGSKHYYQGKEYDYVFDVDISEDKEKLKLPYNLTEDPWHAAHNFLQKNDLSPMFLDKVANFIIQNTEGKTLGDTGNPAISDPLTGGSRYIPKSYSSPPQPKVTDGPPAENSFYPLKSPVLFDVQQPQILKGLVAKLTAFSNSHQHQDERLGSESLQELHSCLELRKPCSEGLLDNLVRLSVLWPMDRVFPVWDALRIILLFQNIDFSERHIDDVIDRLSHSNARPTQLTGLRLLANLIGQQPLSLSSNNYECLMKLLKWPPFPNCDGSVAVASSTVLLNMSFVAFAADQATFPLPIDVIALLPDWFSKDAVDEALLRILCAIGTFCHSNRLLKDACINCEIPKLIQEHVPKWHGKLGDVAKFLIKDFTT